MGWYIHNSSAILIILSRRLWAGYWTLILSIIKLIMLLTDFSNIASIILYLPKPDMRMPIVSPLKDCGMGLNVIEVAHAILCGTWLYNAHFTNYGGIAQASKPGINVSKIDTKVKITTLNIFAAELLAGPHHYYWLLSIGQARSVLVINSEPQPNLRMLLWDKENSGWLGASDWNVSAHPTTWAFLRCRMQTVTTRSAMPWESLSGGSEVWIRPITAHSICGRHRTNHEIVWACLLSKSTLTMFRSTPRVFHLRVNNYGPASQTVFPRSDSGQKKICYLLIQRRLSSSEFLEGSISYHEICFKPKMQTLFLVPNYVFLEFFWMSFSFVGHLGNVTHTCYYQIHRIREICHYLPLPDVIKLVRAFILSQVDYCKSILLGLPGSLFSRLQMVLKASAHLIFGTRWNENVTPLLRDNLHRPAPDSRAYSL